MFYIINLHFFRFTLTFLSLLCVEATIFYWQLYKNCIFKQNTNGTLNSHTQQSFDLSFIHLLYLHCIPSDRYWVDKLKNT